MHRFADVGIHLPYGASDENRTVCPQCSATRRKSRDACLAVSVSKGAWYCHHCGWKGSLGGRQTYESVPVTAPPPEPDATKRESIRHTLHRAPQITAGDPVHTYLCRRGLDCDDIADLPAVLRYHPRLAYRRDDNHWTYHPAMLARVDDPHGNGVSLHRTYLTTDGRKADVPCPKKLMSPAMPGATRGGAIRLYEPTDTLAVAEGIETGMAVHLTTELPVWAALSAGGMQRLMVPDIVHLVVICPDHDEAGIKAGRALARRMLETGRRVKMLLPDTPGADWADIATMEITHAG